MDLLIFNRQYKTLGVEKGCEVARVDTSATRSGWTAVVGILWPGGRTGLPARADEIDVRAVSACMIRDTASPATVCWRGEQRMEVAHDREVARSRQGPDHRRHGGGAAMPISPTIPCSPPPTVIAQSHSEHVGRCFKPHVSRFGEFRGQSLRNPMRGPLLFSIPMFVTLGFSKRNKELSASVHRSRPNVVQGEVAGLVQCFLALVASQAKGEAHCGVRAPYRAGRVGAAGGRGLATVAGSR